MVDAFALFTLSLMNLIKIILSRRHQTKITSIFHSAVQDWVDTENQKDVRIMIHHAYVGRIVCIVQMIGAYLAVVPMILMHFPSSFETYDSNNDTIIVRSVPVGPKCWLPSDISFTTYLGYYSLICVQLFLLANMFLGVDVFAFGLAMHLCGQFQVLNRSLGEFDGGEPVFEQKIKVSKFARRHYSLLQLADDFEVAFNMLIFFELGANTFNLCISEIILLKAIKMGDAQIITAMIVRVYLLYIQIFMHSYIGENLSSQMEKLHASLYNCPWYSMQSTIVKDMRFIMMRNNVPLHLTAGKICNMDYNNFKGIVKSMFSCFSILRLVLDE
uniref:Or13a_6 protein n=2 Tax=Fopius arisanus TaxID=64838 RepID=A0A0C9QIW4_9HYME